MGKRDSCRNSTTGFSENVVVEGTSYQMLEVLSFCFRERVPWVPETFLARFPVSVKSFLAASAFGQHRKFPLHARKTSGTQGRERAKPSPIKINSLIFQVKKVK